MEMNYTYTCPNCNRECSVEQSFTGKNVICPHCSNEFFATPPQEAPPILLPEKIPFFKSGRKALLEKKMQELVNDGELSEQDGTTLDKMAIMLDLETDEVGELQKQSFLKEFSFIQKRLERSFLLTDEDLDEIEALKKKYGVKDLALEGFADLFRKIYLLEVKQQMPSPIACDLMLESGESGYFFIHSTWHQTRMKNQGYRGVSFSVPTGLKGLNLRFGQYKSVRSEEITPLASGILWITSKRILFQGEERSTKVTYKKIIDAHIFSDCLKIEKDSGKADYFSMNPAEARYVVALIDKFKN